MRSLCTLLTFFALAVQAVAAPNLQLSFDGEQFNSKYAVATRAGDKLLEFVRAKDTLHSWTKLVALRHQHLPKTGNDPTKAAMEMAEVIKTSNPKAGYSVFPGNREAMIDFITWPAHRKYVEFSVVRYAKTPDDNAVVSVQFTYRFSDTSPDALKKFKQRRAQWLQLVAGFDIDQVRLLLDN